MTSGPAESTNAPASNTSQKRREMQLIFELSTLKAGGLNINLFFFFYFFILRTRALVVRFLCTRFTCAFFSQAFEWSKVHIPAT